MAIKVSPQLARMGVVKFVTEERGKGRGFVVAYNPAGVSVEGIHLRGMKCYGTKNPSVQQAIAHMDAAVELYIMGKEDELHAGEDAYEPQVERLGREIEVGQFRAETGKMVNILFDPFNFTSQGVSDDDYGHLRGLVNRMLPLCPHESDSPVHDILRVLGHDTGKGNAGFLERVFASAQHRTVFDSSMLALLNAGRIDTVESSWRRTAYIMGRHEGAFFFSLLPMMAKGENVQLAKDLFEKVPSPFSYSVRTGTLKDKGQPYDPYKLTIDLVLDFMAQAPGKDCFVTAAELAQIIGIDKSEAKKAADYLANEGFLTKTEEPEAYAFS